MVRLYITDVQTLSGRFGTLTALVDKRRRVRALAHGATAAGLRTLAAGLLLTLVADRDTLDEKLAYLPEGKPYLPGGPYFNLSHSGDYAVLATADDAVGVDIERKRVRSALRLSERFLHPDEAAFLRASTVPEEDFLTIWTLKESYLKAEGYGFWRAANATCILPAGERAAKMRPETDYRFCRYDDLAPEYRIAACSRDGDFSQPITRVTF